MLALQRKPKLHSNPFAFFTSSLPQALIHAYYKRRKESANVWITCLDTETARTSDGGKIKFLLVPIIAEIMHISVPDRHTFEELDFEDVWLTSDTIVPGDGSSICRFSDLIGMDLFSCVPELGVIQSHRPGVASPIRNLREYWFKADVDLAEEEINFAAQLASTFEPLWAHEDREHLQMHILAWFLTMKEQIADGTRLLQWLSEHGTALELCGPTTTEQNEHSKLCELQRLYEIHDVLTSWSIEIEDIRYLDSSIDDGKVLRRRNDYKKKRKEIGEIRDRKREEWLGRLAAEKAKRSVLATWLFQNASDSEADDEDEEEDVAMDESTDAEDPESAGPWNNGDPASGASQTEDTEMSPARPSELDQRIQDMEPAGELNKVSDDVILEDACEADELDMDEGVEDM